MQKYILCYNKYVLIVYDKFLVIVSFAYKQLEKVVDCFRYKVFVARVFNVNAMHKKKGEYYAKKN